MLPPYIYLYLSSYFISLLDSCCQAAVSAARQLVNNIASTFMGVLFMWRRGGRHTMPIGMEVARRTPPYGLHIVAHGFALRPFTPPYPKGGAQGGV
jgi:hypothetical protein